MSIIKKYLPLILCYVLLNCYSEINAQYVSKNFENIDPKSINTLSSTYQLYDFTFDWNLGQLFSKTYLDTNSILLTTGFLQSQNQDYIIMLPTAIVSTYDSDDIGIKIFPNPVISKLFIYESLQDVKISNIQLYNINGQLLNVSDNSYNLNISPYTINFEAIAPGYYILVVTYANARKRYNVNKYKIIKL